MKKIFVLLILCLMTALPAFAVTVDANLVDSVSMASHMPDTEVYPYQNTYDWVGTNERGEDYVTAYRFDMSPIQSMQNTGFGIDSIIFGAYQTFNESGSNPVYVSVGTNDTLPIQNFTWSNASGMHGANIASALLSDATLDSTVTWNLSSISPSEWLTDGLLTLYLTGEAVLNSLKDFSHTTADSPNNAFLSFEMSKGSPAPVPEPSTWILLSAGLLGLAFYRKRCKA